LQRFVAQGKLLPFFDDPDLGRVEIQVRRQHLPDLFAAHDLRHGIAVEHSRVRAGMVLLGVQCDQVVDLVDAGLRQVVHQDIGFERIDRVDQGGLLAALDQVGVIGCPMGRRHQAVEQLPVRMAGADFENPVADGQYSHGGSTPFTAL